MTDFNPAEIRKFLLNSFSDAEIKGICFDHFPDVYQEIEGVAGKPAKVLRLLEYCQHRDMMPQLVAVLQKERPGQLAGAAPKIPSLSVRRDRAYWKWILVGIVGVALFTWMIISWFDHQAQSAAISVDDPFGEVPPENSALHEVWLRPIDNMVMVYVPGGQFMMGSADGDSTANVDEFPQHPVSLDAFWMDRYEVTNKQYAACVSTGECRVSAYVDDSEYNKDNFPVVGVTWTEAKDYCLWAGGDLPTEAQWEYAARGSDGRIFPWGNDFNCQFLNADDEIEEDSNVVSGRVGCDGYDRASPVGNYSPGGDSWVDAADMSGNVWEWTADWYDKSFYNTAAASKPNPTGPETGSLRVIRGGSWRDSMEQHMRTANRGHNEPSGRANRLGFRCVVNLAD